MEVTAEEGPPQETTKRVEAVREEGETVEVKGEEVREG